MTDSTQPSDLIDADDAPLGTTALTLVKLPSEKTVAFNRTRLGEACRSADITEISLEVIDGQPVVTLLSQTTDATEEDVDDGVADEIGEPMVSGPRLCCAVCPASADNDASAEQFQTNIMKVHDLADGALVRLEFKSSTSYQFIKSGTDRIFAPVTSTWAIVVWELEDEQVGEVTDGDDADEQPREVAAEVMPPEDPEEKPGKGKRGKK